MIRHCEASGQNPEASLTKIGFQQANKLAVFLADYPVDMVVSSSYTRARQSIEPFATASGLRIRLEHRLIERTLSSSPIDNWREVIRGSFEDSDLRAHGGESAREVLDRAWAAINELLYGDYQLPLAVTHGNLLSLILNSLNPSFGYGGWESLSNPDVFVLRESVDS